MENKLRRFEVATTLEEKLGDLHWKGDEHTQGVFFTDEYGYAISKVMAVRIDHGESASEVFYSFSAPTIEEKVTKDYPFKELKVRPKFHHLLFETKQLPREEVGDIFEWPDTYDSISAPLGEMIMLLEEAGNRRERERTQLSLQLKGSCLHMKAIRKKKHQIVALQERKIEVEIHSRESNTTESYRVNANTLLCTLRIFHTNPSARFRFTHDRIMIIGTLSSSGGHQSVVEVVLSLLKV